VRDAENKYFASRSLFDSSALAALDFAVCGGGAAADFNSVHGVLQFKYRLNETGIEIEYTMVYCHYLELVSIPMKLVDYHFPKRYLMKIVEKVSNVEKHHPMRVSNDQKYSNVFVVVVVVAVAVALVHSETINKNRNESIICFT
jgi:hypothetical protein